MSKIVPLKTGKSLVVYKASKILQCKAGFGEVEPETIEKAAAAIREVEYKPFAEERIMHLGELVSKAKSGGDYKEFIKEAKKIVVNLKSTASIFDYNIISDLTCIMLEFLEVTEEFDKDIIDLIDGHQKTLEYLLQKDAHDSSSDEAQTLKQELCEACMRYREKSKKPA